MSSDTPGGEVENGVQREESAKIEAQQTEKLLSGLGNFHYFSRAAMLLKREMIVRDEIEEVGWGSQFLSVFSVS